jgi:hypothetical protein
MPMGLRGDGAYHKFFPSRIVTDTEPRSKSSNRRAFTLILGLSELAMPVEKSGVSL